MRPETRAMVTIDKIMTALSEAHRREVLEHMIRAWRRPLSGSERTRRWRDGSSTDKRDEASTAIRDGASTKRRDGTSTRLRDGTSAEKRDGSSTETRDEASRIPPHPPVVSKLLSFAVFWSNYPKRVGKGEARKAWTKQDCEKKAAFILESLEKQRVFLLRDGGKFVPNPATWLNQNRWEDEPPQPSFLSEKTSGNAAAARAFVEGKTGHDEPR